MKGKLIFFSISALLGLISALEGIWGLALFLLYLLFLFFVKNTQSKWILLNGVFFLSYFIIGEYMDIHNKTKLSDFKNAFQVQFTDEVKFNGDRLRAVVTDTVSDEKMILSYKISTEKEKQRLQQTSLIKYTCNVNGQLVIPDSARNENAFNYQEYLKQTNIFWELQVTEWRLDSCQAGKLTIIDHLKKWRIKGIALIEQNFTKEAAPIAAALIFGTRDLLTEELISSYQKLGVIHLISISGLHVALLVGMIFYVGIRMGAVRERLSWGLIIVLPVYSLLTGATPSVNRSVMMTMMILLARQLMSSIKLRSIDGLCLSFLLLTFFKPLIIYNIGFQLSYIVTFSLLLSLAIVSRYQTYILQMVITSLISQVSALPLLLYYFFEIPLISIVANIIFIPLYSFIFLPGLIVLFILQFVSGDLFQLLSIFLSFIIDKSNKLAVWGSAFSWSRITPGRPSELYLIVYSTSILFAFYYWERRRYILIALSLPWIVIIAQYLSPQISPEGEVSFIDVGQGDSIFIRLPYGKGNYLIDTGGTISFATDEWKQKNKKFEVGKDVLVPYLKGKGVTKIDLLILTHGDNDHIGGSLALMEEIKVKKILLPNIVTEESSTEKKLIRLAKKQNTLISYVYEHVSWKVDGFEFYVVAPTKNYVGDKNGGSIVLLARIGGLNWLFTGDQGIEGEERVMNMYPDIKINVLKVGHHGSKTSTSDEFIQHYTPEFSIISVGEKNGFGHPHPEVLKILEAGQSTILRTDLHGEITYKFSGRTGTFYKEIP